MLEYFANLETCLVGMEACGGAHDWARRLTGYGHQVKLMPPQFVKPYVKSNKNDMRDAEAICEAVTRPNMRFVPVKTAEQQALLALHRARQGYVKTRTGFANQMRGLLAEYGIVVTKGITHLYTRIPEILEDGENGLPSMFRNVLARLLKSLKQTDQRVKEMELEIKAWHQEDAASVRLATIPGIGPLTASALTATIGDARDFKSGRQLAASLGLGSRTLLRASTPFGKPRSGSAITSATWRPWRMSRRATSSPTAPKPLFVARPLRSAAASRLASLSTCAPHWPAP